MDAKPPLTQQVLFSEPKAIPTAHPKDTRYVKHCVDCGLKVAEWERGWDPPDAPYVGKRIFHEGDTDFGGRRCDPCRKKIKVFLETEYYTK